MREYTHDACVMMFYRSTEEIMNNDSYIFQLCDTYSTFYFPYSLCIY
uniref:Uncharacterized protein n=1 Tax=Rhizophora mucronata TaxID=61149 RepID=A0A2P2NQQ2_RHIMU